MTKQLEQIFDVAPVEVVHPDQTTTVVIPEGEVDTDHEYARSVNYEILSKGSEALDIAMRIARESENPRAIEVMSGLMKNLSDISKNLVVLNKDKAEAKSAKGGKLQPATQIGTQNVVFAGSSSDLNKLLKGS